jgi:uncharacterized protein YbaR (Trm112 family)
MMVSDELVNMLACPETRQPVARAPAELLERLNARIRQGTLRDAGGRTLAEPIEAGLLRQDGRVLYPIIDDIPRMLVERGIPVDPGEADRS